MSLFKQLWLAIILLLAIAFGSSLVVSSLAAQRYLQQQLYMKNVDNAAALALSLSQQEADGVLLELTLAAQFDTGHYELIALTDPDGQVLIRREDRRPASGAPAWLPGLLPLEVEPGIAQVQKGWQQVGTLTVRSHSRFAYQALWESTRLLALLFLCTMAVSGLLGSLLLRKIITPLNDVVNQAEAIGQRRFVTLPEPKTLEFKRLVSAMNTLSKRIRGALQQEASRLNQWQKETHTDGLTGLLNREPFLRNLDAALGSDDVNATGCMALVRIARLSHLNQTYGRKVIDGVLEDIGTALNTIVSRHSRWAAARLNGSDFAIMAPRATNPRELVLEMQAVMEEALNAHSMEADSALPSAATLYTHEDTLSALLTRLDSALIPAHQAGSSEINITFAGDIQMLPVREQMTRWRGILQSAFLEGRFSLAGFPVLDSNGRLMHMEAPVRLREEQQELPAATFLPWINRLEMSADLDQRVIEMALASAESEATTPLAVNLSVGALVEPAFLHWLDQTLSKAGSAAGRLWLEVPESMAFRHFDAFRLLTRHASHYGCKVGIEHAGHQLADIGQLHDVGLDYFKVDAAFIREIDSNAGNQTLLRTLCTVGHSIGVTVIAEGVRSAAEWAQLRELGFDGATGPAISELAAQRTAD
tara:strand:+ start:133782 stop:135722 length:1941 start_codon:yes stop_codon:yes gene_type:complete